MCVNGSVSERMLNLSTVLSSGSATFIPWGRPLPSVPFPHPLIGTPSTDVSEHCDH